MKIQNFPEVTNETILNPDNIRGNLMVHVHAGTRDNAKCKNITTNVKKKSQKGKKCSPETKVVLSGLIA